MPPSAPTCHFLPSRRGKWLQLLRPYDFEWNQVRLQIPDLPETLQGVRIIHLTDFHLRKHWHDAFDRLIARVREADADLLLFTGDFVDNKRNHLPAMPNVHRFTRELTARRGCYAIVGNHDNPAFTPALAATPFHLIAGERKVIDFGSNGSTGREVGNAANSSIAAQPAAIELIGLPGNLRADLPPDFAATMPPPPHPASGTIRIVLSHFPDHLRRTPTLRPHLFLAGHTHGGQVCLPGRIPIIKHDSLPRRCCSGIHRIDDTWLIVNRGFGCTTLPIRFFCPPEVLEIELTAME